MSFTKAIILGCEGTTLTSDEKKFFQEHQPLGFILFARNIETPQQVKTLVEDLRSCVDHDSVPVLIDQEGGRVYRLSKDHWRVPPAGEIFGKIYKVSPEKAHRALYLNYRLIASDLIKLGIDVDCAPILDTRVEGADLVVGDRAYSYDPEVVADLGKSVIGGLHHGGVQSIIKHMPTHGPADVDSHKSLPVIDWSVDQLKPHFKVFQAHASAPWGMTAHIVYKTLDPTQPATYSKTIIQGIIRQEIGFQGVLISDDLGMKALSDPWAVRAEKSLTAGCDAALHCSGVMDEMKQVIKGVSPLSPQSLARLEAAYGHPDLQDFDEEAALRELDSLLTLRKAS